MASLDEIMGEGDVAPGEPREITEEDRAANPFGMATLERERRDAGGRFVSKGAPAEGQPEPDADGESGEAVDADPNAQAGRRPGAVPPKALQAERQKRQAAETETAALRREIAELRGAVLGRQQPQAAPPKPDAPPEFWSDPNAATDHRLRQALSPVEERLQTLTLNYSHRLAVQEHGAETVNGAMEALRHLQQHNPAEYQRLEVLASRSTDPVGDVAKWYKNQRALQTYGADPDAYINAEIERRMNGQGGAAPSPAPAPAGQRARLPTSFASQANGGPRGGSGFGGPRPLSDIMSRG